MPTKTAHHWNVQERSGIEGQFLSYFPHRYDYIKKGLIDEQWTSCIDSFLTDREILLALEKQHRIYGVRPGRHTQELRIDIDRDSKLHESNAPGFFLPKLQKALQPLEEYLGLKEPIKILWQQSSASGGHWYSVFFADLIDADHLAHLAAVLLELEGLLIKPGVLEICPNTRTTTKNGTPPLQQAFRLPCMPGYAILDEWGDFNESSITSYVRRRSGMEIVGLTSRKAHNLRKKLQKRLRRTRQTSQSAADYIEKLAVTLGEGFTDRGQTQEISKALINFLYCFGHVPGVVEYLPGHIRRIFVTHLQPNRPLEGEALERAFEHCMERLPGFREHSRHQGRALTRTAINWARSIQKSTKYFHYPVGAAISDSPKERRQNLANLQKLEDVRDRISTCVREAVVAGGLPGVVRERAAALKAISQRIYGKGFSSTTLYRHKDLWHPDHLISDESPDPDPHNLERISDKNEVAETQIESADPHKSSIKPWAGLGGAVARSEASAPSEIPGFPQGGLGGCQKPDIPPWAEPDDPLYCTLRDAFGDVPYEIFLDCLPVGLAMVQDAIALIQKLPTRSAQLWEFRQIILSA